MSPLTKSALYTFDDFCTVVHDGRKADLRGAGFFLRPEWLWQEPLPDNFEILEQMLSRTE